jgi:hypothetical protein
LGVLGSIVIGAGVSAPLPDSSTLDAALVDNAGSGGSRWLAPHRAM